MLRLVTAASLLLLLVSPTFALAGGYLPEGRFQGTGSWESKDGSSGHYSVEATIQGSTIETVYNFDVAGKPQRQTTSMSLVPDGSGGLQVFDDAKALIGSASCLADQCLLNIASGPVKIVEAVRVRDGRLEAFGTKSGPGFHIAYSSSSSLLVQK